MTLKREINNLKKVVDLLIQQNDNNYQAITKHYKNQQKNLMKISKALVSMDIRHTFRNTGKGGAF